jgi:uncharacterized protein (UPF0332 family)
MIDVASLFLEKAQESLVGAESEFSNRRFNNCASRSYYACFQAAVAALLRAGIHPPGNAWSHEFVPAQFVGVLINRRKLYSTNLREILARNYLLRRTADYSQDGVSLTEATRALRRTRDFVTAIATEGGESA